MTGRLLDALARRTGRERALLAALVLVVLPLALWTGVLAPLAETRAAAARELAETRALQGWVAARLEAAGPGWQAGPGEAAPIGLAGIEAGLERARLRHRLSALGTGAGGAVTLRFDAVGFADLMRWIEGAQGGWGYRIARLEVTGTEDPGLVAAALRLEPAP